MTIMKRLGETMKILILFLLPLSAFSQTVYLPNVKTAVSGTMNSGLASMNVNVAGGTISATNPSIGLNGVPIPLYSILIGGSNGTNLIPVKVSSTGVVSVDASATTQPISAVSLPLPTGASTSALQTTGNTALGTLNTTLGTPFQSGGSIANTSFIATQATGTNLHTVVDNFPVTQPISGTVAVTQSTSPWVVDGSGVTQPVSGTFWQATQPVSIATMPTTPVTGTFYQATQPVSIAGTVATTVPRNTTGTLNSAAISGVTSVSAPANAVGFTIQADDTNTANFRWAVGATASASSGIQMQPGRSEAMDLGATISICPESGTQTYIIQWKSP
jgi:hypothetical protein